MAIDFGKVVQDAKAAAEAERQRIEEERLRERQARASGEEANRKWIDDNLRPIAERAKDEVQRHGYRIFISDSVNRDTARITVIVSAGGDQDNRRQVDAVYSASHNSVRVSTSALPENFDVTVDGARKSDTTEAFEVGIQKVLEFLASN